MAQAGSLGRFGIGADIAVAGAELGDLAPQAFGLAAELSCLLIKQRPLSGVLAAQGGQVALQAGDDVL
jgi:hypothetical protein